MGRIARERGFKAGGGLGKVATRAQRPGEVAPEPGIARRETDRGGENLGGMLDLSILPQDQAIMAQRARNVTVALEQDLDARVALAPARERLVDLRGAG